MQEIFQRDPEHHPVRIFEREHPFIREPRVIHVVDEVVQIERVMCDAGVVVGDDGAGRFLRRDRTRRRLTELGAR